MDTSNGYTSFKNTVRVIQEVLGISEEDARLVAGGMGLGGIRGAIRAELVDDETTQSTRVLEVESEDNRIYRIYMGGDFSVFQIRCMETGSRWHRDGLLFAGPFNDDPEIESEDQDNSP